jgi:hydroxymethylbilane synthase
MADKTPRARSEDIFSSEDIKESIQHTPKRQKRTSNTRQRSNSPEHTFLPPPHHRPGDPTTVHPLNDASSLHLHPTATPEERRRRNSIIDPTNLISPTSRSPYATFQIDPVDESSANQNPAQTFRIGTRKSKLARIQTEMIATALQYLYPDHTFPVQPMSTMGDMNKVTPLYQFDAKALWTRELEVALLEGEIDMIVHSLKDMPTTLPEGCALGAITEREDPRDAVVMKASLDYKSLAELPEGSVVGTSSVRRIAQLRRAYPHLHFADVRGNVDTRLNKLDHNTEPNYSAIILAEAGLARMELNHRSTCLLSSPTLLHAVGQGSLGIEIRSGDEKTLELLKPLNHRESRLRCLAERSLMRALEGGCSVPIGVETKIEKDGKVLNLKAVVVTVDGHNAIHGEDDITFEDEDEDSAAETLGMRVAQDLLDRGAQKLLDAIRFEKEEHIEKGEDVVGNDDVEGKTVVGELPPLPFLKGGKTTTTKDLPEVNGTQVV